MTDGSVRLGVLTDSGQVTEHIVQCLDIGVTAQNEGLDWRDIV